MKRPLFGIALLLAAASAQPYDHVTITAGEFVASFAPLGTWIESNLGMTDTAVTVEHIYANYPGRDNAEKVRNFIRYAYQDWGTTHVLLGGDVEKVPCRMAFITITSRVPQESAYIPCDLYFADLDGSWDADGDGKFGELADSCDMYPDVYVGRVPASTIAEVGIYTGKFFTYSGHPNAPYLSRNLLTGFDLYDVPPVYMEQAMELYDTLYVPEHLRPSLRLYDSYTGDHRTATVNELSQGVNLWVHADHGDRTNFKTGYLRHGWMVPASTLASLTNGDNLTTMLSAGCYIGDFTYSDCTGELYIFNPAGGAVAVVANSSIGRLQGPDPLRGATMFMMEQVVRGLVGQGSRGSFDGLTLARAEAAAQVDTNTVLRWAVCEYNLLGEPAMPFWVPGGSGAEESHKPQAASHGLGPNIVRGVLFLPPSHLTLHSFLFSLAGRKVLDLHPGANDVRPLAPGVYFVRAQTDVRAGTSRIVIAR
jgi:Peptidase family C25